MSRNKIERVAKFLSLPNTFDVTTKSPASLMNFFGDAHPLVLELGCGHGTYTTTLARLYPEYNYVGVDIKSSRMLTGARLAHDAKFTNVAFLRAPVDMLEQFFSPQSVTEIWLPFSDPYPRPSKAGKRLTAPTYLSLYKRLLRSDGCIHVKTDDPGLYQFTLESVKTIDGVIEEAMADVDVVSISDPRVYIRTSYEDMHRKNNKKIAYVRWRNT